jgi:hypothetical protein
MYTLQKWPSELRNYSFTVFSKLSKENKVFTVKKLTHVRLRPQCYMEEAINLHARKYQSGTDYIT